MLQIFRGGGGEFCRPSWGGGGVCKGEGLQYNTGTRPLCGYSYQIYVFKPVNNDVYGTCNLQTRFVRSTHARDTLSKFFGRQA